MSDYGGGERQGSREHIDRTIQHLVEKGGLPPAIAEKKAREARIRNEQREDGDRK